MTSAMWSGTFFPKIHSFVVLSTPIFRACPSFLAHTPQSALAQLPHVASNLRTAVAHQTGRDEGSALCAVHARRFTNMLDLRCCCAARRLRGPHNAAGKTLLQLLRFLRRASATGLDDESVHRRIQLLGDVARTQALAVRFCASCSVAATLIRYGCSQFQSPKLAVLCAVDAHRLFDPCKQQNERHVA